jgi:hypothetical protein
MLTQNTNIRFQGFHPSEFTKTYLNEKISLLKSEVPFGATMKAAFTRNNHMIKGVVSVYSSAGRFFAVASGKKLKLVTDKLTEQIRRQTNKWKTNRFEKTSLKNLSQTAADLEKNYELDSF